MRARLLLSVALLAGASLAYEVLLTRLYAIIQWHHFAQAIIALALLGIGASGTVLSLRRDALLARFNTVYPAAAAGFGISAVACWLAAQRIGFTPDALVFAPAQVLHLGAAFLLLSLPFFCAGLGIGLALMRYTQRATTVYAADLIGAGAGAAGMIGLLAVVTAAQALMVVVVAGLLAAALVVPGGRRSPWHYVVLLTAAILLATFRDGPALMMSPYKPLQQALRIDGASVVAQASGASGEFIVVANERVPLRHVPGLSVAATQVPPLQLGVFVDGDGPDVLTADAETPAAYAYLEQRTAAAAYAMGSPRRVLLIGGGGDTELRLALGRGADTVDIVEPHAQRTGLMRDTLADFTGGIFKRDGVTVHHEGARPFLARSGGGYDLIQIGGGSFDAGAAGLGGLAEGYLLTVEALEAYLDALAPGGYVSVTRWMQVPPRDALRLVVTATEALGRHGVRNPADSIAMLRGWHTVTLLIRRGAVDAAATDRLQKFCDTWAFDPVHYPGFEPGNANRRNALRTPVYYDGVQALLGDDRAAFLSGYKFDLRPATDDRPYFSHAFRWRLVPEWLDARGRGGAALIDPAWPLLLLTLAGAFAAGTALILWPLRRHIPRSAHRWRHGLFFTSLGLGFLLVEITLMQKSLLLLRHPVVAVGAVLSTFLIAAGIGSALAGRLASRAGAQQMIRASGAAVGVLAALAAAVPAAAFAGPGALPDALWITTVLLLMTPIAVCMGMPFALGLVRLREIAPAQIPWAWAINGCASVTGALLAHLIAIDAGFSSVLLLAALLYTVAAATAP